MDVKVVIEAIQKAKAVAKSVTMRADEKWYERTALFSDALRADFDKAISVLRTAQLQDAYTFRLYRFSLESQTRDAMRTVWGVDEVLESSISDDDDATIKVRMERRAALLTSYKCLKDLMDALKPFGGPEEAEPAFMPMPTGYDELSWANEVDVTIRTRQESEQRYAEIFSIEKLNHTMMVDDKERFLCREGSWYDAKGGATDSVMGIFNKFYWFLVDSGAIAETERNYSLLLLRFTGRSVYLHDPDAHIYWRGGKNELYFLVMKAISTYRTGGRSKGEDASRFFRIVEGNSVTVPEPSGEATAPYAKLADENFRDQLTQILL